MLLVRFLGWLFKGAPRNAIAAFFLIGVPAFYLYVTRHFATLEVREGSTFTIYIFLIVAVFIMVAVPFIERAFVKQYREKAKHKIDPDRLYIGVSIVSMVVVDGIYIYGFIAYLMTGVFANMLYLYGVGAIASVLYWPRKNRKQAFLEKVNAP